MRKGQRLLWLEAQEDRQIEQALRDSPMDVYAAVEEIGRWFYNDKQSSEPTKAFQTCRAYYRRRPRFLASKKRQGVAIAIAHKLEIVARLSIDRKAQRLLGVRLRKEIVTEASILKAAHRLYEGLYIADNVPEVDIQTLRRNWEKEKSAWLLWAERVPYAFWVEMKMKETLEQRTKKTLTWKDYMTRDVGL